MLILLAVLFVLFLALHARTTIVHDKARNLMETFAYQHERFKANLLRFPYMSHIVEACSLKEYELEMRRAIVLANKYVVAWRLSLLLISVLLLSLMVWGN